MRLEGPIQGQRYERYWTHDQLARLPNEASLWYTTKEEQAEARVRHWINEPRRIWLMGAILRLAPMQRRVLFLWVLSARPLPEIARALSIPPQNTHKILCYAKAALIRMAVRDGMLPARGNVRRGMSPSTRYYRRMQSRRIGSRRSSQRYRDRQKAIQEGMDS